MIKGALMPILIINKEYIYEIIINIIYLLYLILFLYLKLFIFSVINKLKLI